MSQWIQGRRPGGLLPLFLDQTEAWMTASPFTKFLDDRPPSQGPDPSLWAREHAMITFITSLQIMGLIQ